MSNDPLLQNLPQNLDILVIGLSNNSDKLVNFISLVQFKNGGYINIRFTGASLHFNI